MSEPIYFTRLTRRLISTYSKNDDEQSTLNSGNSVKLHMCKYAGPSIFFFFPENQSCV